MIEQEDAWSHTRGLSFFEVCVNALLMCFGLGILMQLVWVAIDFLLAFGWVMATCTVTGWVVVASECWNSS